MSQLARKISITKPTAPLKHGDFTGLAQNYSQFRPDYAESALTCILSLCNQPPDRLEVVDVGAGTGIWSRQMAQRGVASVTAIEPNDDMRHYGQKDSEGLSIRWQAGSGEATGLADESCDLVTMASSFHWTRFEESTREFHRILRTGGRFTALWNPRYLQENPMLVEIEAELHRRVPELKRVSSGRSDFTEGLRDRLAESPCFTDVVYLEARHTIAMTPEQYLGAWWSVNDIQFQAGPERFKAFMAYVEATISGLPAIEATYQTRAWSALKQEQAR